MHDSIGQFTCGCIWRRRQFNVLAGTVATCAAIQASSIARTTPTTSPVNTHKHAHSGNVRLYSITKAAYAASAALWSQTGPMYSLDCRQSPWSWTLACSHTASRGLTENAWHKNAGHETDGPNCRAWNCKTWNCRTWICKTWEYRMKIDYITVECAFLLNFKSSVCKSRSVLTYKKT